MSATGRRFDVAIAAGFFVACEVELLLSPWRDADHLGTVVVTAVALALMTLPLAWRRQRPLAVLCVCAGGLMVFAIAMRDVPAPNVAQFAFLVPPYSVAAYTDRVAARVGLGVYLVPVLALDTLASGNGSTFGFGVVVCVLTWAVGRYLRGQRKLAAQLGETTERIIAEGPDRETLAVAEQRTRIARELQAVVAERVGAMTVQAQVAQRLLRDDPAQADEAMATVEATGRQALDDMRRILGVLRRADAPAELAPQPGVGQIAALVERARAEGRQVTLRVDGEPRALPTSIDLGAYRVVREAITDDRLTRVDVALEFASDQLDVRLSALRDERPDWPTVAMRERVALCRGEVDATPDGDLHVLVIGLPTNLEDALA